MANPPADWYPDPTGRYDYRYWDGDRWTGHVSTAGSTEWDPLGGDEPDAGTATAGTAAAAEDTAGAAAPEAAEPAGEAVETAPDAPPGPAKPQRSAAAPDGIPGVRGALLDDGQPLRAGGEVEREGPELLRVGLGGDVLAARDAVAVVRGSVRLTAVPGGLVRCSGDGELLLGRQAARVHLLELDDGALRVTDGSLLGFAATITREADGDAAAAPPAGTLRGSGWAAVASRGTPVTLQLDGPASLDPTAPVAWSPDLQVDVAGGGGPGGSADGPGGDGATGRLVFRGSGLLVVQTPAPPPGD